jgi:hypothetical protein
MRYQFIAFVEHELSGAQQAAAARYRRQLLPERRAALVRLRVRPITSMQTRTCTHARIQAHMSTYTQEIHSTGTPVLAMRRCQARRAAAANSSGKS